MSQSRDADFQEHVKMWRGFTRFIIFGSAAVVVVLAGLAIALL
jgi:hypothetical protein